MTTKTKGKVKVGKLDLNKETVKNLTSSEAKKVKGGKGEGGGTRPPACPTIGRPTSKTGGCCYTD